MATRPTAVSELSAFLGETEDAVLNYARAMVKAPGLYSLLVGKGHNRRHLQLPPLLSLWLACIIGSPNSVAIRVPAIGGLVMAKHAERRERTRVESPDSPNPLTGLVGDELVTSRYVAALTPGKSLFDVLLGMIDFVTFNPDSALTKEWLFRARLAIQLAPVLRVDLQIPELDRPNSILHYVFHLADRMQRHAGNYNIPQRSVTVGFSHIEKLAELYRDTLQHEAAAKSTDPTPSGDAGEGEVESTQTENAALAGAALPENQVHDDENPGGDTPNNSGETRLSQARRRESGATAVHQRDSSPANTYFRRRTDHERSAGVYTYATGA